MFCGTKKTLFHDRELTGLLLLAPYVQSLRRPIRIQRTALTYVIRWPADSSCTALCVVLFSVFALFSPFSHRTLLVLTAAYGSTDIRLLFRGGGGRAAHHSGLAARTGLAEPFCAIMDQKRTLSTDPETGVYATRSPDKVWSNTGHGGGSNRGGYSSQSSVAIQERTASDAQCIADGTEALRGRRWFSRQCHVSVPNGIMKNIDCHVFSIHICLTLH